MSLLNIGGDKDDLFYRYKMPPVQAKLEGKGNGTKTVLPNIVEVAKALNRPPMYPTKYFGTELGAQTKHEPKNDRYIVNGHHDTARLQELLQGFIEKFVLCGACGNPETDLKIIDGNIERHCLACGKVTPIDMRHRLTNFILNNPPEGAVVSGGKGKGKGKKGKATKAASKDATPRESDAEGDDNADELHRQFMADAKHLGESKMGDDDWSVDMSEEAQKKRQAELLAGVEQLSVKDKKGAKKGSKKKQAEESEDEFGESDPLDALASYVQAKGAAKVTTQEILAEVKESGVPNHLAAHVLAQVLAAPDTLTQDLKRHAAVFRKLAPASNARAQKYFLGGLERLVATHGALKKVPVMLKVVYELELVEEAVILAWGKRVTKKWTGKKALGAEVREAAKPFIEWLETAESDEESDEDEDDE